MMRMLLCLPTSLCLCYGQPKGPTEDAIRLVLPAIDSLYQSFATANHAPGVAYGIVYNGRLIHTGAFGYADMDTQVPVTPRSVFRIASMTKSFVAFAILQLRDAGLLSLDDPINRYLPEWNHGNLIPGDAPAITIRHLLTHAAGLPEDNPWGDRQLDISDERFLGLIRAGFSFSNAPGIAYEYSNTGYALLGEIVRRVSGRRYDQFIQTEILNPLGMKDTYWEYTAVPDSLLAKGYHWTREGWTVAPMLHDGAYGSMGGLLSSVDDFARYALRFLDAWPPRDGEDPGPLRRSSLREMQQPWSFNALNTTRDCPTVSGYGYGLGWTRNCEQVTTVGHSGGLPGFGSNWLVLPEYGLGVICFANVTYAPASTVNREAIDLLIQRAELRPRPVPVSPILKQRQEELVQLLPDWSGAEQREMFAMNFFLDNDIGQLRDQSRTLFAQAGKIRRIHEIVAENNLRGAFIIECEHHPIKVHFTLSPERIPRIQQVTMTAVGDDW